MFTVGSIVRAKRGSKKHRAMVALADPKDASGTLCIIWEPNYPKQLSEKFIITPKSVYPEADPDEATIKADAAECLLSFETDPHHESSACGQVATTGNITMWKERGDQLLRLGDASAATSYYEKALFDSSSVSIGGTIVISIGGFPKIAEVDCVDDDSGGTIDVTLPDNGEEMVVKQSEVLLSILEDDSSLLQERLLLNIARCMLQLSDSDVNNRPKYLKSAVLATSLAITISLFREQKNNDQNKSSLLPINCQTALLLRCKAFIGLSKWAKATSDAKKLVEHSSNKKQGQKLLVDIERKKKTRLKTDKKLAKEICLLVQSATAENESKKKVESHFVIKKLILAMSPINTVLDAICSQKLVEEDESNASIGIKRQDYFAEIMESCWTEFGPSKRYVKELVMQFVRRVEREGNVLESDMLADLIARVSVINADNAPDILESCYVSFFMNTPDSFNEFNPLRIRIFPYHNDVALRLWEAGNCLSEFLIQNPEIISNKAVFELGSGCGATGLAIAACCSPSRIHLTDYTEACLLNLEHNLDINREWLSRYSFSSDQMSQVRNIHAISQKAVILFQ